MGGEQSIWIVVKDSSKMGHQIDDHDEVVGQALLPLSEPKLQDQKKHVVWIPLKPPGRSFIYSLIISFHLFLFSFLYLISLSLSFFNINRVG